MLNYCDIPKTKVYLCMHNDQPIVYSCSGCSNLAQIANDIAITLDSRGIAQMSCLLGVAGKVQPVVDIARSSRPIIAIDGCKLACTKSCLNENDLEADYYFDISAYGIEKKGIHESTLRESNDALQAVYKELSKFFDIGDKKYI